MLTAGEKSDELTWASFQLAFGCGWNAMLVKRIFDILDSDGSGTVSCEQFVEGLIPLVTAPNASHIDEKLFFLFRCLDLDGSGGISREELLICLHLFISQEEVRAEMTLSLAELDRVAVATLRMLQLDESGLIRWADFRRMLASRPGLAERMIARLSMNVNRAMATLIMDSDAAWLAKQDRESWAASSSPGARHHSPTKARADVTPHPSAELPGLGLGRPPSSPERLDAEQRVEPHAEHEAESATPPARRPPSLHATADERETRLRSSYSARWPALAVDGTDDAREVAVIVP